MGRALRTKETLPDFHEWCRVTQHPLLFLQVDRSSTDPRVWGVTASLDILAAAAAASDPPASTPPRE